ncbi:MAG: iron ABC transporter permease [Myxococcales bacterium]|nr:iron ABC transporter permease [Myxococcales bacterium]
MKRQTTPLAFLVLLLGLALSTLIAAALGESSLDLVDALTRPESQAHAILFELRLPKIALAALVGAALGIAGAALQALLKNPLADPFILGVSGGAAFGATLSLALGATALGLTLSQPCQRLPGRLEGLCAAVLQGSPTTLLALLFALLSTAVVYGAARHRGRMSPLRALLAGVVFNALASAAITFVKVLSPPDRLGELTSWLTGSLGYPQPGALLALALFEGIAFAIIGWHAHGLNLLALGDRSAGLLGLDVERARCILFVALSLLVAAAVSVSGMIGFVGLIVPHLLRLWMGADQKRLLPASALLGASFLILADLAARRLLPMLGTAPPVGALTALIGAPFFLGLLKRGHEED